MHYAFKIKIFWFGLLLLYFTQAIQTSHAQFSICLLRSDSIPIQNKTVKICIGSSVTLVARACNLSNNSETFTYAWTNIDETYITVNNPKFLVQEEGRYQIAVKGRTSNTTIYDTIKVIYQTKESLNITPASPVKCRNDNLVLRASTAGFKNYRWRLLSSTTIINSTDSLVNPVANREYVISAVSPNGCKVDSNIFIVQAPSIFEPSVNLGPKDTAICEGKSLRLKNLINNRFSHFWSTGSRDTVILVNKPGKYWLRVKTEICSATDSIEVKNALSPVIERRNDFYACFGKEIRLNLNIKGDTNLYNYEWLPNSGLNSNKIKSPIVTLTNISSYKLKVTAPGGCFDTATVKILINPKIEISLPSKDTVLCGGASIQLQANVRGGKPFLDPLNKYKYNWFPNTNIVNESSSNPIVNPLETTRYRLRVTDAAGCSDTLGTLVKVYNLRIKIDSLPQSNYCIGDTLRFKASIFTNSPSYSLLWKMSTGKLTDSLSPQISFVGSNAGNYTIKAVAKDQSNCQVNDNFSFNINTPPSVNTSTKYRRICFGDSLKILATASGGSGINYQFEWLPITQGIKNSNTSNPTFIGNEAVVGIKKYSVKVKDSFGCKSKTDSVTVETIPFFVANLGGTDTSTCVGDSIKLSPLFPIPPSFTYNWVNVSTGTTVSKNTFIYVKTTGLYQLRVEDAQSGCSNRVSKQVNILNPPEATKIIASKRSCASDTLRLIAFPVTEKSTITWTTLGNGKFSQTNRDSIYYLAGKAEQGNIEFKVTLNNICGKTEDTSMVTILPSPILNLVASPMESIIDSVVSFSNTSEFKHPLFWDFRDGTPVKEGKEVSHTFKKTNTYSVIVFSERPIDGCPALDSIQIIITEGKLITELFIPNVFSPNSLESDNAALKIFGKNISEEDFVFAIFNRWGELIYKTENFKSAQQNGWNGTDNSGNPMERGNYTYTVKGNFKDGKRFEKYGNVTLLK